MGWKINAVPSRPTICQCIYWFLLSTEQRYAVLSVTIEKCEMVFKDAASSALDTRSSRLFALADCSLSETASPICHCWFVSAFRGNGFYFDGTGMSDGHLVTAKWGERLIIRLVTVRLFFFSYRENVVFVFGSGAGDFPDGASSTNQSCLQMHSF
jgi:hypothetical protein